MEKTIYRLFDRSNNEPCGSYERGYHTKYDFSSPSSAREYNCHGIFKNRAKYRLARYRVTVELIDEDVDPPPADELIAEQQRQKDYDDYYAQAKKEMDELNLSESEKFEFMNKKANSRARLEFEQSMREFFFSNSSPTTTH